MAIEIKQTCYAEGARVYHIQYAYDNNIIMVLK